MTGSDSISRRSFIRRSAAAGLGIAAGVVVGSNTATSAVSAPAPQTSPALQAAFGQAQDSKARIAVVHSASVLGDDGIDHEKCLQMLDTGMRHVFNVKTALDGWKKVAGPQDVVAVKVNTISSALFTSVALANAVCQRLIEAGVTPENIIVFDRTSSELERAGYPLNRDEAGVRCYGTDGGYGPKIDHRSFHGSLTKILTDMATVLVNLPVLKDHGGAQVTLAMKNHYGTIADPGPYHANNCDPYVADINDIPVIKEKTRLIICDAIRGCFQNGPGPNPGDMYEPKSLIIGTDPVACDTIGTMMIDAERKRHELAPLGGEGKLPLHINTAASYGLGTNDPVKMNVNQVSI